MFADFCNRKGALYWSVPQLHEEGWARAPVNSSSGYLVSYGM